MRHSEEYTKHAGVEVTVDFIAHLQLPAKTAAEAKAQWGHDIIFFLRPQGVGLYEHQRIDLSALVTQFKDTNGGYYPWSRDYLEFTGVWRADPWFTGGGFLGC
jgi:hypothetical protein